MSGFLWATKEEREHDPTKVGLVQLAFPILLESLLRSTVNMIDVVFMSRISDRVVSAISVASQYIMLSMIVSSAVATGTMVCMVTVSLS